MRECRCLDFHSNHGHPQSAGLHLPEGAWFMSTMRVYTREFRESAVGLMRPSVVSVLFHGLSIRVAAEDLGMPLPHAAQLGPRQTACAAKDDCQSASQRTKARHRENCGAHPYRVASNLRLTEDHARASETWSRRSSQYGLANHAGVRNPCETCAKVSSNKYAECARACAVARSSGGNCACPRSLVNRAQPK